MQDHIDYVSTRLRQSAELKHQIANERSEVIAEAALLIAMALKGGNKLLLCGNGGSAADCQHMAAELVGRMQALKTRRPYPALALTTDTSFITAWANDVGFEDIFSRQVEAHGLRGDVLLAISTSGGSANVFWAVRKAQEQKMHVVTLTGPGGKIAKEASVAIKVPSKFTQLIQEAHLCIEHMICEIVERVLMVGT